MIVRRLNQLGLDHFEKYIDSLKAESPENYPPLQIENPDMTEAFIPSISIDESRKFTSRFDFAQYIYSIFLEKSIQGIDNDGGLWTWLTLLYFEQFCPDPKTPGETARWILQPSMWRRYYRHLAAGPYYVYRAHSDNPERIRFLLSNPLHTPGDVYEQIASRLEFVSNRNLMKAASLLYFDSERQCLKTGASSKREKNRRSDKYRGAVRRFVKVCSQLDVTWDLFSLEAEDILRLLPPEFDKFKPA